MKRLPLIWFEDTVMEEIIRSACAYVVHYKRQKILKLNEIQANEYIIWFLKYSNPQFDFNIERFEDGHYFAQTQLSRSSSMRGVPFGLIKFPTTSEVGKLVLRPREEDLLEDIPVSSKSGELRPILEAIIGGGPPNARPFEAAAAIFLGNVEYGDAISVGLW